MDRAKDETRSLAAGRREPRYLSMRSHRLRDRSTVFQQTQVIPGFLQNDSLCLDSGPGNVLFPVHSDWRREQILLPRKQ